MMISTALRTLAIFFVLASTAAGHPPATAPSLQPVASQKARVKQTLNLLAAPTKTAGHLSGQNVGHSNLEAEAKYQKYVRNFGSRIDHTPAIVSIDYGWDEIPQSLRSTNRLLIEHARAGGLVTISMHPPNPWHNSDSHDTKIGAMAELLQPGTPAHRRWRADLDRIARGLAELRDADVVVLWRPLHEMNGGWFWWCPEQDGVWLKPAEYRALWRDMFYYFTREKQLDNLLWVYSAAVQKGDEQKPAIYYYPGDAYVDVVGLSWYLNDIQEIDLHGSYSQLAALGKPMGLNECGPSEQQDGSFDCTRLLTAFREHDRLRFFVFWHSWPDAEMAFADIPSATELLAHPRIISRENLSPTKE